MAKVILELDDDMVDNMRQVAKDNGQKLAEVFEEAVEMYLDADYEDDDDED